MLIINIFGEIEQIVISKRLGITLSNLPQDWREEIFETMEEEIYQREYVVKKYNDPLNNKLYNAKKIVEHKNFSGILEQSNGDYLKEIANKLICISVGDFENSMLQKKNTYIDSPACEIEFAEKWIYLYEFLIRNDCDKENLMPLTCMYSSEKSLFERTNVLRTIYAEMSFDIQMDPIVYNQRKVNSLIDFGKMIDSFLEKQENFYILDYILTAIADDSNYNEYHLFKNYSLIEMIIGKEDFKDPSRFDNKLAEFMELDKYANNEKNKILAKIIRQIRNKIAHGDFIGVRKKLEDYAASFMKSYYFDYFEYNRENWIYLNICCELDRILADILWKLISGDSLDRKGETL
ncbi:hypothetical protein [Bacillus pumilus]|uniref:hypothetical protein n=1 Tax=Bacillus pumilus TaxID=1408 RepID=UPI00081F7735|nr:hypothetical protein [Bacillus pumilus]AOC57961.1 hypothetical protein BEN31_14685 [Bacillus pumilus]MBR0588598.1 hypothetical protein [Bacillus pumilus DW2J2]MBR0616251.1 hypothetical protein [Bacillus pumilus]MBR0625474.1 hypothetical protein [Bacillus pumilus]MCY7747255.1 hypothetical protein [Bacillus pumilus]